MNDMTKAQKKWLIMLRRTGFVECGGWGRGQRNRPLFKLVKMGLADFEYGPRGSCLKVQGFLCHADFIGPFMPATSETLRGVVSFLNGR